MRLRVTIPGEAGAQLVAVATQQGSNVTTILREYLPGLVGTRYDGTNLFVLADAESEAAVLAAVSTACGGLNVYQYLPAGALTVARDLPTIVYETAATTAEDAAVVVGVAAGGYALWYVVGLVVAAVVVARATK